MKKKLMRVVGYIICAVLLLLCIMLIFASAAFGAEKTVKAFGYNIYLVENDEIPTAPKGSAVMVKRVRADVLTEGKLVLYMKTEKYTDGYEGDPVPVLGYVKTTETRDGVYYITVAYHNEPFTFPEAELVGSADYSSTFWGGVLGFIRTPMGIMVIAVLPCAALILFEIIRAAYKNRPEPEVVPRVKNADDDEPPVLPKLSVNGDGKAAYSRNGVAKPLPKDSSVLFNYGTDARLAGRQKTVRPENQRPIIPLTDRKPASAASENEKTSPAAKTGQVFDVMIPPEAESAADVKPAASENRSKPPLWLSPTGHSDKQSDKLLEQKPERQSERPPERKGNTAEIPARPSVGDRTAELSITAKKADDAFFAQSGVNPRAPVGRQNAAPQIGSKPRAASDNGAAARSSGKRSSQILASKNYSDFLSDDEDDYPRSGAKSARDRALDDIFAGIDQKKRP